MWRDTRALADDGDVDCSDLAASIAHEIGGVAQEPVGGGAAPARIARREMHPDIARTDGAEHRVGYRVQPDIGVGMTDQPEIVRDLDAADEDMVAGTERVHIKTLAGSDVAETES